MIPLLINVLLALVWTAITGELSLGNLLIGFLLGYIILLFQQEVVGESTYYRKLPQLIGFTLYFVKEVIVSSLRVARDVVTPQHTARPGIIALPLDARSDFEISTLASVITLTPGTLSLDVSADRATLYVHCMFVDDPDEMKRSIKNGLERKLLEVLR